MTQRIKSCSKPQIGIKRSNISWLFIIMTLDTVLRKMHLFGHVRLIPKIISQQDKFFPVWL